MRASLIEILRCPDDGRSPLVLRSPRPAAADRIERGELECTSCHRRFPVRAGIPSLLPRELAALHLSQDPGSGRDPAVKDMLSEMSTRDQESSVYDRLYDDRAHAFELETYKTRLAARPGERILDVGCGTGRFTKEFTAIAGQVVGADFSMDSLCKLRERLPPDEAARVQLVQCEIGHLPLVDATFDAVVATSLFSNVPTAETRLAGLHEVHRVLAPGGRFLVTVYNHCWVKRARQRLGLSLAGRKQGYHSGGRIPYYNFVPAELTDWVGALFHPGPCFGAVHRVPLLSAASPLLARALDRLLFHVPYSLPVFAAEVGMVAHKPRDAA